MARGSTAAARGAMAQAKAALSQAQVNLAYTKIVSPTDGVVISRNVDVGQTVAASLSAPTLFVIAKDLREMQVDTSVAEADVGKLQAAMSATFTVDAYPGERFRGKVRQIRNAAQTVQNVVTYDAVIDVDNSDLKLRPGMTANITFIAAEKDNVLRAPNAAMRFRPAAEIFASLGMPVPNEAQAAPPRGDRAVGGPPGGGGGGPRQGQGQSDGGGGPRPGGGGGGGWKGRGGKGEAASDKRTVWLLRNGQPQPAPLRVGLSDGSMTEIVEGEVHEGDVLIVDASLQGHAAATTTNQPPGGMRRLF